MSIQVMFYIFIINNKHNCRMRMPNKATIKVRTDNVNAKHMLRYYLLAAT